VDSKNKNRLIKSLKKMGVKVQGIEISKSYVKKIFGGIYVDPEWILLTDYRFKTPHFYIESIEKEEQELGRVMLPTSFSIGRYGKYLNQEGDLVCLDGMVYQYSMQRNPRNVHYAFHLFLNDKVVAKNASLRSLDEAKTECSERAKALIESDLYDLT
jgi:hypothetical protein